MKKKSEHNRMEKGMEIEAIEGDFLKNLENLAMKDLI